MPAHTIDFWGSVSVAGGDDCWIWSGPIHASGYGSAGKHGYAHKVAYEDLVGPVSPGLDLDHVCHTEDLTCAGGSDCLHRRCVNPAHLEPVTHVENILRGRSFSARNLVKTECDSGHPFTAENTKIRPSDGARVCRTCQAAACRRYRQKVSA